MSWAARNATRMFWRGASSSSKKKAAAKKKGAAKEVPSKGLEKLKKKQALFQQENGLPVWLKGGFKDKLLYQLTLVGLGVGMIMSVDTLVRLSLPK